ncbi:uncharacterized protein BJ212DRAFT_1297409 [Suillus subaureus]|uniref:Uncharacterized protein n=1 Tax=Suillus subaureus TaxID=48587 RepID=A0A9P7EHK0_9AGAM|nr:uncharacterized protein BJ212DRAFT_1297409 [Suillus subaureus]KAG1820928.1 hypothetical protein BJ212DRAFT_1297409 [Suillus subaureus]
MPTRKRQADTIAKRHFGKEVFDMCWSTASEPVPSVETLTASSSAKPHYGGQMPMIDAPAKASSPAAGYQGAAAAATYDLCWDDKPQSTTADSGHIFTPSAASQYDMHWDGQPAMLAAGYQGGFDMCWGDSPSDGGGENEGNSAANNAESLRSQDTQVSMAPSSAPTEGSVMARVEAGKELVCQASDQLARLDTMIRDNESPAATEIPDGNQGLLSNYQSTNDIAEIQHLLQMFRQIDDPLTVLELALLLVPFASASEGTLVANLATLVFPSKHSWGGSTASQSLSSAFVWLWGAFFDLQWECLYFSGHLVDLSCALGITDSVVMVTNAFLVGLGLGLLLRKHSALVINPGFKLEVLPKFQDGIGVSAVHFRWLQDLGIFRTLGPLVFHNIVLLQPVSDNDTGVSHLAYGNEW